MFYSYIMTNMARSSLFIEQTDDLFNRIWEHQAGIGSAFTRTYGCDRLVWFEVYESRLEAFERSRELQALPREDVARLISQSNAEWGDLSASLSSEEIFAHALRFERPELSFSARI